MEAIKLLGHVDESGHLVLDLPLHLANQTVEVLVQVQGAAIPRDANGWPIGFFERTFGALADEPLERPEQLPLEVRDDIE
jgi:hypothetical protein